MSNSVIQKSLFQDGDRQITFIPSVDVDLIEVSRYNPRKTWDDSHVMRLAQLIESNGFDTAFALKCHKEDDGLRCFAGSNRLKAARKAGKQFVPVFLYEGYEGREIWRMAYEDNEQADAQQQFSIVDVWMDYKEKSDSGMTQQQIAIALFGDEKKRTTVQYRLKLADLPGVVLQKIVNSRGINERSCLELIELSTVDIFNDETLLCEIIDNVLARTKEPTSKQFKAEVERYNAVINAAETWAAKLEGEYLEQFIDKIKDDRNAASIERQGTIFFKTQQDAAKKEWERQVAALNAEQEELMRKERELEKASKIKEVTDWIINGDSRKECANAPHGITLIFTDPPYGVDFQSNRRIATAKAKKIENDDSEEAAMQVTKIALSELWNKAADDSSLLLWCDWKSEFAFRQIIEEIGWVIKNSMVWIKPNHGTGDLKGSFAPKHERLLFAVKGRVELNNRIPDVFHGSGFLDTNHPTPKPVDAITNLIECLTLEGDIVADPFMGSGPTGVSAVRLNRKFWGCEKDVDYWGQSMNNIKNEIG